MRGRERAQLTLRSSIYEQLLRRILKRFRGGLVSKAHRLLYRSTLGSRVIKKKRKHLSGRERAHLPLRTGAPRPSENAQPTRTPLEPYA